MQAFFTESNTLPPLIIISRVHFMNLEATPLSALDYLTRRSIYINIPLQPNVTCPQTCIFFTESNTLPPLIIISRVHFMYLEATPLSALDSLTRRSISLNIPLQPNVTCPQTCMQAFFTESNTLPPLIIISRVHFMNWKPHPFRLLIPLLDGAFLLIFHCNQMNLILSIAS